MSARDERLGRLAQARLYLVTPCTLGPGGRPLAELLPALLKAGVDVVQLRDKDSDDELLLGVAREAVAATRRAGALLFVNDRPDLAVAADADGVHLGQHDIPLAAARATLGGERLVGLSTHTPAQVGAARDADYIGVGPVHATPTKPGRPAVGLELVAHAAGHARGPWFAIGGIDAVNVAEVLAAGATRVAVVRAITEAPDPVGAAATLREALDATLPPAGAGAPTRAQRRRAREAQIRTTLQPLAPGERPRPLVAATLLAGALGLANLIAYLAGAKIGGKAPGPEVLVFSAVMAAAAVGMWRVRYWAVLGFQVLLALSVVFFGLLLVIAANLAALAVSLGVIAIDGWLFWKLVRVLGRMQAPPR